MNRNYIKQPDDYRETISHGIRWIQINRPILREGNQSLEETVSRLKEEIDTADAIVIGAGAGLSTAAGFTYSGERFRKYFSDFEERFGIHYMYSGGFYPYPDAETRWAFWARNIYVNRYMDPPKPVYDNLYTLIRDKDYFVITTNVDHCFQKAGFDKKRLFYTQGDYGLFQSVNPANQKTYDNEEWVMQALEAQGFEKDTDGVYQISPSGISMRIPTSLIPKSPDDGSDVTMNLRADDSFVEDEGWHKASAAYADFIHRHENLHTLYLEIGVGANTPVFYVLNPIRPKMAKNNRFYPGNGYFMKELSRITDSERLRRCA